MRKIKSTVVICTYNRSSLLADTIDKTLAQDANFDFEVLLIDNNSTDATGDVAAAFLSDHRFQYMIETQSGLSYARNRGIAEAKGEIIIFLDDDARPENDWLSQITTLFDLDPTIGVVGGRVHPDFQATIPPWLEKKLWVFLSCIDYGDAVLPLNHGELLVGANVAFRKSVFEKTGFFDISLGRKGKNLLSNEEVELRKKVESFQYKICYNGKAIVHHLIPGSRMTKEWFMQRVEGQARSNAILAKSKSRYIKLKLKSMLAYLYYALRSWNRSDFSSQLFLHLYRTQIRSRYSR